MEPIDLLLIAGIGWAIGNYKNFLFK